MALTNSTGLAMEESAGGLIIVLLTLTGFAANTLAIIVTIKTARQHPVPPNIFISSLASVDLFGLIFTTTPTTATYASGEWIGGLTVCIIQGITSIFVSIASGLAATLLSMDRFLAVARPFWYRRNRTEKNALICVVFVLLFAGIFSFLPLMGFGQITRKYPGTYCTFDNASTNRWNNAFSSCFSALCLFAGVLVIVCNLTVTLCMCKSRKNRIFTRVSGSRRRLENEMQYVRTMLIVSLLYIVCWIPFMVYSLRITSPWWNDQSTEVWLARLLVLKFVLDPYAYVLTRRQYRQTLVNIICCRRRTCDQSAALSRRATRLSDTNV